VSAWAGCYGGTACVTAGTAHGCADCSMTEAECTAAGKTWMANATSSTTGLTYCAAGTPATMGCRSYRHGSGYSCDCTMGNNYQTTCSGTWQVCDNKTTHTGCDAPPSMELMAARMTAAPPSPPVPPPSPPSLPPAPPQKCIPKDQNNDGLLDKPTAPEDPVNEPCYSHQSCRHYDPATGPTVLSGSICCVKVGTCDGLTLSGGQHYYEGGCRPMWVGKRSDGTPYSYYASSSYNVLANSSTSTKYPTSTEGCVKQGECALPHIEQIRHYTTRGSPTLEMGALSAATMDRLLANAIEAYPDACRDPDLYPRLTVTASHFVMAKITLAGDVSTFTTPVLTAMEEKVSREMGVAPGNVDIKAEAGSVVLTINIGYDNANIAAAAKTTMATAMSDTSKAAAMLSTPTMAMTDAMVTAPASFVSGSGASASPPPPALVVGPAKAKTDSDDGLSVGAIAGIAVGASVGVILVAGVAIFMMNKKKTVTATKGQP